MDILSLAPIILLCVYRPDKEHKSWHISAQASAKCLDRYTELALRPLNSQESRRLIQSLLQIDNLPESVRESILEKAGGNPFFVEEVIRSLMERDIVYKDGDRWVARDEIGDMAVPDTIQNVIMARIDRLEDEVRYVLQSASVIGRIFQHRLLQYTTHQEHNLDSYLWQLEERELVYEERSIPELEYSFRHVLTQETAYNTILSRRRKEFHRKVAEGYEALYGAKIEDYYGELAYHYSRSDNQRKALDYLVKAGDKSREAYANEEAIGCYQQALKITENADIDVDSAMIGHLYQSLGDIYFTLTKYEEVLGYCSKALKYTTDKETRARIYGTIGWTYHIKGENPLALEYLNAGIAELGDNADSPEMARLYIPLSWDLIYIGEGGNTEKRIDIILRGLKIVEGTEHYFELEQLYSVLSSIYAYRRRDMDKAFEYSRKAMEAARKSGNIYLIAHSSLWFGSVYGKIEKYDDAIKLYNEALEISRKIGDIFGIYEASTRIAGIYEKMQDLDAAIECLENCPEAPHIILQYATRAVRLAELYLQKDNTEKVIECCKKFMEAVGPPFNYNVVCILNIMESVLSQTGKRDEFISYCKSLMDAKKETFQGLKQPQLYLEPKELRGFFNEITYFDDFDNSCLRQEWEWIDPKGDCGYDLTNETNWLELYANLRPGREDRSMPRLLQKISGDFAVETKLKVASDNVHWAGGILIWLDKRNFIQFGRDYLSTPGMVLSGSIQETRIVVFGRGMLDSDALYLRLERMGHEIHAFCSSDGKNWMTCGEVSFHASDPIQVGIYATAVGRYGEICTAVRFDYFRILRQKK